jgi:hypothetical protein
MGKEGVKWLKRDLKGRKGTRRDKRNREKKEGGSME